MCLFVQKKLKGNGNATNKQRGMCSCSRQECCKPISSFSAFYTCLSILSNPILFTFFHSSEEFLVSSMELCNLVFQKVWLILLFVCTITIFYWEGVNTEGIIISKKLNYSRNISVKIRSYISDIESYSVAAMWSSVWTLLENWRLETSNCLLRMTSFRWVAVAIQSPVAFCMNAALDLVHTESNWQRQRNGNNSSSVRTNRTECVCSYRRN